MRVSPGWWGGRTSRVNTLKSPDFRCRRCVGFLSAFRRAPEGRIDLKRPLSRHKAPRGFKAVGRRAIACPSRPLTHCRAMCCRQAIARQSPRGAGDLADLGAPDGGRAEVAGIKRAVQSPDRHPSGGRLRGTGAIRPPSVQIATRIEWVSLARFHRSNLAQRNDLAMVRNKSKFGKKNTV